MLLKNPEEFERIAHEWAVKHAGAPEKKAAESSSENEKQCGGGSGKEMKAEKQDLARYGMDEHRARAENADASYRYHGYNPDMVERFCAMGFDVDKVVSAFEFVGMDPLDGQDYELEEEYMGDITARLFGEP